MRLLNSLLIIPALSLLAPLIQAATICNGHAELCSRLYSNVTFIGAHDSYAVGSSMADDQDKAVTAQLVCRLPVFQVNYALY